MNAHLLRRLAPWFLVLGSFTLNAQDSPLDLALKLRSGYQVGNAKDNLGRLALGFGVELGFTFSISHRIGLEIGWAYKPGKEYCQDLSTMPTATGRVIDLTPGACVDIRKNEMKGLAGRLSYQKSFGDFGLIGGVQIGGGKFRQEYFGDIRSAISTPIFRDVYNGTPEKNTVAVSPFAGVTYRIDKISSFELNVVALRYTAIDYLHQAGLGTSTVAAPSTDVSRDSMVEHRRTVPHLEIAYVLHF